MIPVLIVAALLAASLLAVPYLRELDRRAEAARRRHDAESYCDHLRAEQRKADEATLAVADAFRAAMEQHPSTRARMDRIRQQIAANHEREVAAFRAELDAYGRGGAA